MARSIAEVWFLVTCIIMTGFGALFLFGGFQWLPVPWIVAAPWLGGIYGSMMLGWGTLCVLLARRALQQRDPSLIKLMLASLGIWLALEAAVSLAYRVWLNAGVDFGVSLMFGVPGLMLLRQMQRPDEKMGRRA